MNKHRLIAGLVVLVSLVGFVLWWGQAPLVDAQDPRLQRVKQQSTRLNLPPPLPVMPEPPRLDDDRSTPLKPQGTLEPRVKGKCEADPGLWDYLAKGQKRLERENGDGIFPAKLNFRQPISEARLEQWIAEYRLRAGTLLYVTNSDVQGSFGYGLDTLVSTEQYLRTTTWGDPRLVVEGYVSADVLANLPDLQRLSVVPEVLLVDLGQLVEFQPGKFRAEFPVQPLFWRYERACK